MYVYCMLIISKKYSLEVAFACLSLCQTKCNYITPFFTVCSYTYMHICIAGIYIKCIVSLQAKLYQQLLNTEHLMKVHRITGEPNHEKPISSENHQGPKSPVFTGGRQLESHLLAEAASHERQQAKVSFSAICGMIRL